MINGYTESRKKNNFDRKIIFMRNRLILWSSVILTIFVYLNILAHI